MQYLDCSVSHSFAASQRAEDHLQPLAPVAALLEVRLGEVGCPGQLRKSPSA